MIPPYKIALSYIHLRFSLGERRWLYVKNLIIDVEGGRIKGM